jgi:hypothetical protein
MGDVHIEMPLLVLTKRAGRQVGCGVQGYEYAIDHVVKKFPERPEPTVRFEEEV